MAASSDALRRLKSTDPPQWLAPSADLSAAARAASRDLFAALKSYTPKSPFEKLLTEGFDAEQIWQQIDIQTQPLVAALRREVRRVEKDPDLLRKLRVSDNIVAEAEDFGDELDDEIDDHEDEEEEESEKEVSEDDAEEEEEEEEEKEDGKDGGDDDNDGDGIEDRFLKIKDLEKFLEDDEAREFGLDTKEKTKNKKKNVDEFDDDDDEEEEDDDEFREFGVDGDEDEADGKLGKAKYEDFFVADKKKKTSKKKSKVAGSDESGSDDDEAPRVLSTHEKEREKLQSRIEQMEKSNLDPKSWTMQGEVTATKRPINSALEVDLDFEHNVRPPPVITEEITASLEDMIKSRILEGLFDDVQKARDLPTKAPRELKELDENKSKKGLAEVYEDEYVQKTHVGSTPMSFADEEKKEASDLFKRLCLKLDALSHFHFTPKPVIEDMSLPENVPAIAMEEVGTIAVSDANMLAPQELFSGKGDIKDETELTKAERKRRRANKKRKFKAETVKRMANKPRESKLPNDNDDETAKERTKKSRVRT